MKRTRTYSYARTRRRNIQGRLGFASSPIAALALGQAFQLAGAVLFTNTDARLLLSAETSAPWMTKHRKMPWPHPTPQKPKAGQPEPAGL